MRLSLLAIMLFAATLFGGVSAEAAPISAPSTQNSTQIDDDDDKKKEPSIEEMKKQVEMTFAQMLEYDAKTKKFKIKKEFTKDLPVPAPLIENFLNGFIKNDNGRPVISDDERFKQMLPMLKRFMGQGRKEMERFQKMTPEERQKALKKAQGYGKMLQNPKARDGMNKLNKMLKKKPGANTPKAQPKRTTPKRMTPKVQPKRSRKAPSLKKLKESLEQRVARLEKRIRTLEKALRNRGPQGMPQLPEMGGVDAAKDIVNGLVRLSKIMKKEDWDRVTKVVQSMLGEFKQEDLQEPQKLLQKIQKVMDPSDLERFMEILSDFLETEEGQAFEARVEKLVSDLEKFMSSEQGQQMMERVRKLAERFQKGDLPKNFEKLFGQDKGQKKSKKRSKKSPRRSRKVVSRLY